MKKILYIVGLLISFLSNAQTPIPMASQPALTYTATFDSIVSWSNNFASGAGAEHFGSVVIGGTATIPNATKITTNAVFITSSMASGGLYKDSSAGKLIMLVTGTTNNSNAIAVDLFMDFTGAVADSLYFDWTTVFNGSSTSNRTSTLKVYATTDGITFTELSPAEQTLTNYVNASGTKTLALPSSFSNSATAQLRFYYYNSAGGSTGSRPAIALDNISVSSLGTPCSIPTAAPTNLTFTNVTPTSLQVNYVSATPTPDEYLVVSTTNTTLAHAPLDGKSYNVGDTVADGEVVYRGSGTSFTLNNLTPLTAYTFYIYSSNIYCNGIIRYLSNTPLIGSQTTPAGPPCATPTTQPTNLQFSNVTNTSISGNFTASPNATEYLVVRSLNSSLSANPVDGIVYNIGDLLGTDTVVYRGSSTNFTANNLTHSTNYHFFVFSINNYACSGGPAYLTNSPLTAAQTTNIILPCAAPAEDATNLIFQPDVTSISGFFNPGNPNTDGFLIIISTSNSLIAMPQDGTVYTTGSSLGGGTIISTGKNYSFTANQLAGNSTYYFFIFPYNDNCIGGPNYKLNNYLTGQAATVSVSPINYYYGNLHSHSSYSDGNQNDRTKTPTDDYEFARNALCMDFLGISEHNHYTANNNPGMTLAEFQPGLVAADNYTAAHPGFLALHGVEWGTLTNGGHSLVYGIDSLIGWETLNGSPNYDIYVPKNDFLSSIGLFSVVNSFNTNNAFATLAHPSFNDFGNIANIAYDPAADSAVVGIAVESGPAFSTDTNYSSPGSDMEYLPYYMQMLSLGYHAAPMIDHDNHNMTFGRTSETRTAVIAPSLSKNDFIEAVRNRHFYATQDCDTRANIMIYGEEMGTIFTHQFGPAIHISANDPTASTTTTPHIKLMYGKPGSSILPVVIATVNAANMDFTDATLAVNDTGYYYADITIGSKRTITAPVWYIRDINPPLSVQEVALKNTLQLTVKNNPAKEVLSLEMSCDKTSQVQFTIYSLTGQKMSSFNYNLSEGTHSISLPVSSLPQGMFIIEASTTKESARKKFVHF